MPKKVSSLTLEDRNKLTNAFQVIVTNPVDYELFRVPVTMFRGASVFTGDTVPTSTPEDPLIPSYIAGDVYIQNTPEGKVLFSWDNVNNVWLNETKLNGVRVLSATDFPQEVNLDLRETNFLDANLYEGDYYLNKTLNLLYGGYSAVSGFGFGEIDFSGYESFRAPTTFEITVTDADGYDDLSTILPAYIETYPLFEKLRHLRPIDGDKYLLKMDDDTGHGGYVYTFDGSQTLTGLTVYENLHQALGYDGVTLGASKKHAREAQTFNLQGAPVQDDKKYRQGDNVFDVTQGVLYYGYKEGEVANSPIGDVFEGTTVLAGSSLKMAKDNAGAWISPTGDDSLYKEGDFILTRNLNTPRIHGGYSFGQANSIEYWPIFSVLRTPATHVFNAGTTLPATYTTEFPEHNGTMIVDNDHIEIYYGTNKSYIYSNAIQVGYGTPLADRTLTITTDATNRQPKHGLVLKTSSSTATPSVDNTEYYDGQFVRNAKGDVYKYVEDFTGAGNHKFEIQPSIRGNVNHVVDSSTLPTVDHTYVPDTANDSNDWGGATVQDSDTLEVRISPTVIHLYDANVNESTNVITWVNFRYKVESTFTQGADNTAPTADGDVSRDGDVYRTLDGGRFLFDKDIATEADRWVFQYVDRDNSEFIISDIANTFELAVSTTTAGKVVLDGVDTFVKVGDRVEAKVAGTNTNKKHGWKVIAVDYNGVAADGTHVTLEKYNPNGVRTFTTSDVGRPNPNDADYTTGDFIDSSTTGWRYIYQEGTPSEWQDFIQLKQTAQYVDKTTSVPFEVEIDNEEFYFLEK